MLWESAVWAISLYTRRCRRLVSIYARQFNNKKVEHCGGGSSSCSVQWLFFCINNKLVFAQSTYTIILDIHVAVLLRYPNRAVKKKSKQLEQKHSNRTTTNYIKTRFPRIIEHFCRPRRIDNNSSYYIYLFENVFFLSQKLVMCHHKNVQKKIEGTNSIITTRERS